MGIVTIVYLTGMNGLNLSTGSQSADDTTTRSVLGSDDDSHTLHTELNRLHERSLK